MMHIEDSLFLLKASAKKEMTVKEAVEIIELVTRNPETIREVLKIAEEKGLIKREGKMVLLSLDKAISPKPKIKKAICDSSCRRCGIRIKNCFYIVLEDHQLGPYGSECVQKIL